MILEGIENEVILIILLMIVCSGYLMYFICSLINRFSDSQTVHSSYENEYHEFLNQARQDNVPVSDQNRCPICLERTKFSIKTSCSHLFCGKCFLGWNNTMNSSNGTTCPVCRSLITFLLQYFTQEEISAQSREKTEVINFLKFYNRRFSGMSVSWLDQIRDFPTILRNGLWRIVQGDFSLIFRIRIVILILGLLLYVLSPLDILPEFVFGAFGFIDDLAVIFLACFYLNYLFRQSLT